MKGSWKYAVGILLSALLIWWFLHDVDFDTVGAALMEASPTGLLVGIILMVGHNVFRVWRWKALLAPVRRDIPFRPMFTAVILGYMTTWLVPGRIGEVVRPALLTARERIPLGPCLGSVVIDRLMDMLAVVTLVVVGSFMAPLTGDAVEYAGSIRSGGILLVLFVTVCLTILITMNSRKDGIENRLGDRRGLLAWLVRTMLSVAAGTEALRKPALLVRIIAHSMLAWIFIGLGTWIGLWASGVTIHLGAVFILQFMLAVGVAIPTPGGAGTYHAAMKAGLVFLFGVMEAQAVTAGILLHLAVVLPIIFLGLALLWIDRISWRDLLAAAREVRSLGSGNKVAASRPPLEDKP